jgi:predicted transporter
LKCRRQKTRDYRKNKHFREGGTMKKIILVLMVVLTLGMVGKGIYTALAKLDTAQDVAMECTLADAYPCEMPVLTIDPCTDCAMF